MNKYYFTYGSSGMDFKGGWTVVEAPNKESAIALFKAYHPLSKNGLLNCCSIYCEYDFKKTSMYEQGNFGHYEWETITVERSVR